MLRHFSTNPQFNIISLLLYVYVHFTYYIEVKCYEIILFQYKEYIVAFFVTWVCIFKTFSKSQRVH